MAARAARNPQRQQAIARFIYDYSRKYYRSPSMREIGDAVGLSSLSTISGYLERMCRDGILSKGTNYRSVIVLRIPEAPVGEGQA